jgi:hypothetical protein
MASNQEQNKRQADQERNLRQRESLQNAYAALLGQQSVQSFTAFTFEEAMDAHIEFIEGKDSKLRPNELNRVERVKSNVLRAIEEIKKIDPNEFVAASSTEDVNTAKEEG